ncbi:TlpA family protein disulfide reductase [Halovivax cerinus]|uniref:TlpA family protein disulfide reductase n=1 Tax=Halovivax cerinus TaxID=1487865 RepID=A0ABD5NQP2_9EURY|nr:TlpA family protein disulfide reductase [Halovivax cerinus]
MRRRELIAGAGALAVLGGAGAMATTGWRPGSEEARIDPIELPTIPGTADPAETTTVPERGRVSVVEIFATWCDVCARQMQPMGRLVDETDTDVQIVSVTNEPLGDTITREDVADWWERHDGRWPVAHDPDLDLTATLDAAGVPYTVVLDAENRIVWRHSEYVGVDALREQVTAAKDHPRNDGGARGDPAAGVRPGAASRGVTHITTRSEATATTARSNK